VVFGGRRVIGFTMAGNIERCALDLEQTNQFDGQVTQSFAQSGKIAATRTIAKSIGAFSLARGGFPADRMLPRDDQALFTPTQP